MPIKYNLTKYDMLAEKIHELAQTSDQEFSAEDEMLKAEATLIASFASSHSWQTYKIVTEGNISALLTSHEIKNEHALAKKEKWKRIKNMDIQQVACTNINGMFPIWLRLINADKNTHDIYKLAWIKLKEEFAAECDGITLQKQR